MEVFVPPVVTDGMTIAALPIATEVVDTSRDEDTAESSSGDDDA